MSFECHSEKQDRALLSEKKITLCATGIQWGKTSIGAYRMAIKMFKYSDPSDAFIITAPTYKIMKQSTLPAFIALMEPHGKFNKADYEFRLRNGGTAYFRTGTDPDSIVGITNVRHIWGDEAGKYGLYFWENIQGRASFKDCQIDLTTSPYSLNWVYKDLIKPYLKGERDDIELIQARSDENPYFPKEEYKRRKQTMDPRRFNMMYGGEWGKMEGLVYDCWDDELNIVDKVDFPVGTKYVAGVDWGYTDPFVIKVRAITPSGHHFGVSEFYKTKLTISEMIRAAKQKQEVFDISRFYCDPSQPAFIEEFNAHGLTAIGADNDIRKGIDLHYELIKTRKYKELRGRCPYSMDERENYHYPEPKDLKPDQSHKEAVPVDQENHAMDADRYITISTYNREIKRTPSIPTGQGKKAGKTRLDILKKGGGVNHSEKWS